VGGYNTEEQYQLGDLDVAFTLRAIKGIETIMAKKKPTKKLVKPSESKEGPIRHAVLPPELLEQIGDAYEAVGPYLGTTLEQFEIRFMRDMHPEKEVAIWRHVAEAWHSYHEKHLAGLVRPEAEEQKIVGALVAISSGITDPLRLGLPPDVGRKLIACFAGNSQH
jgi:hypothetical protein